MDQNHEDYNNVNLSTIPMYPPTVQQSQQQMYQQALMQQQTRMPQMSGGAEAMPMTSRSSTPAQQLIPPMPPHHVTPDRMPLAHSAIPIKYDNNFGNNALYNSAVAQNASTLATARRSRDVCDMVNVKSMYDSVSTEIKNELDDDLKIISGITLLDDEDILDSLFLMSPGFKDKVYAYTTLRSIYTEKYPIFDKYRSVLSWLNFCLAALVFGGRNNETGSGLAFLTNITQTQSPVIMSKSMMARVVRRRKAAGATDDESAPLAKQPRVNEIKHPFFETSLYKTTREAFEIGKMLRYCFPTEFGVLTLTATPAQVTKYKTGLEDRETVNGIRGVFAKPLIGSLQTREVKNNQFYHILDIKAVGDVIAAMCGKEPESDVLSVGKRKDMRTLDLQTGMEFPKERLNRVGYEFVVFNNFNAYATTGGTVQIKSYTNAIYRLDGETVDLTEDVVKEYARVVSEMQASMEEQLDRYENEKRAANETTS